MKTKNHLFIVVIIIFGCYNILAQNFDKPFVINPRIGDTLNILERNTYLLFQEIRGFNWAVFYLKPDSMLDAQVNYNSNGIIRDTLIENYKKLKSLDYHINAKYSLDHGLVLESYESVEKQPRLAKGIDLIVVRKTGEEKYGELLSVRKETLLMYKSNCDGNIIIPDCVWKENTSNIDKLVIEGKSNLGLGIGLGLAASIVSSIFIYKGYYNNIPEGSFLRSMTAFDSALGTIIITIVGLTTLGAIIGSETSTPDTELKIINEEDIQGLSQYSRYPINEPSQLRAIE